jgi:hypothetical protein
MLRSTKTVGIIIKIGKDRRNRFKLDIALNKRPFSADK